MSTESQNILSQPAWRTEVFSLIACVDQDWVRRCELSYTRSKSRYKEVYQYHWYNTDITHPSWESHIRLVSAALRNLQKNVHLLFCLLVPTEYCVIMSSIVLHFGLGHANIAKLVCSSMIPTI
jgi:hypothetical protein